MDKVAARRVFISYRREETPAYAGRLYDRLSAHFGESQIFMDVDSIEPGVDFTKAIMDAVASCDVLLALIGRQWLTMDDGRGRRRIDIPGDYVNLEIRTALERDVRVIPVLVEGAGMPDETELPTALQPLSRRQALEISHRRFRAESTYLIEVLEGVEDRRHDDTVRVGAGAATPQWKLHEVEKSFYRRKFVISRKEVHTIEYIVSQLTLGEPSERIKVDDRTVATNKGKMWMTDWPFTLVDDGERFMASITGRGSKQLGRVTELRLEIDGLLIYKE